MRIVEVINNKEQLRVIRWVNLIIGLLQLYYWWFGAPWYVLGIAILNIGVWSLTRQMQVK